jgi:rhamnogalacturonan I rhamnosyltransferase
MFCVVDSNFGDIFDVRHFIDSLRAEVQIINQLPESPTDSNIILQMPPVSWSDEKYYLHQVWSSSYLIP